MCRLLRLDDVDAERALLRFWRGKGGKTLLVTLHPDARAALERYLTDGRPALVGALDPQGDPGCLFRSERDGRRSLGMNAFSLTLTRRYHAGGGTLAYFGSHRIRHGTTTLLASNGLPFEELSRYMGHASTPVTRRTRSRRPTRSANGRPRPSREPVSPVADARSTRGSRRMLRSLAWSGIAPMTISSSSTLTQASDTCDEPSATSLTTCEIGPRSMSATC